MRSKLLVAAGLAATVVVGLATPAFAHVTTDPESAPRGGEITLRFRVPNEASAANTTQLEIDIPTDHPLLGVEVEPLAGWTVKTTQVTLNPPVQTDDGPVSQAVNQIIWTATAAGIAPGQFQEFPILVQTLPTADQVAFKAVQTYSNGDVVRWIDPVTAANPKPDHPTPILTLTPATGSGAASAGSKPAGKSDVNRATTVAVIGLVIGAVGLVVGGVALVSARRRPGAQA